MREDQKAQFMAYYGVFVEFYGKQVVAERAELAWQLVEPLSRTNEQLEDAFREAMRAHTGEFAPQFTAVLEQLRSQSSAPSTHHPLPPPKPSSTQDATAWISELQSMLADAKARGPMSEEERRYHNRVLDSAPRDPQPRMAPCQFPGCPAPGTISPSTTGGGPWYCAQHFFG